MNRSERNFMRVCGVATHVHVGKPSEADIAAAGVALSALTDIGCGFFPAITPHPDYPQYFDDEDPEHLRYFYDVIMGTLDDAPGWPSRVIGGMCYVIMNPPNAFIDVNAGILTHPQEPPCDQQTSGPTA